MDGVDGVDVVDTIDKAEADTINTIHVAIKSLTKKETGGDLFLHAQLSIGFFSRGRDD